MKFIVEHWITRWIVTSLFFILGTAPTYVLAQNISPFQITNTHPFVQIHGVAFVGEATTLAKGESKVHLTYALSSNYAIAVNDTEALLIDGESTNITFSYARGVGKSLQLAISLPYVGYDAGNLDGFINNWHEAFNLQQGGRNLAPNNRLRVLYQKNNKVQMDFVTNSQGLGDISFNAQLALGGSPNNKEASALAINLKVPTGDSETLQGSGAYDLAVWYKHEKQFRLFDLPSGLFYSTGLLFLGKGDILPEMQKSLVLQAGGGIGLNFGKYWGIKAQLDYNSPFYSNTEFNELGGHALQLVLGSSVYFTKNIKFELGLSEDLLVDASPDIVFFADFSAKF